MLEIIDGVKLLSCLAYVALMRHNLRSQPRSRKTPHEKRQDKLEGTPNAIINLGYIRHRCGTGVMGRRS